MARLSARFGLTRYQAEEYYHMALQAYEKRNLEEAIINITSAIDLYPYNSEYFATRGLFYMQDGVNDQAANDFDAALRLHAYELLANYGQGVLAYKAKDYAGAQDAFLRAWAADQQRPETLYYLALTAHRQRDNEAAIGWMQQAYAGFSQRTDRQGTRDARNAERWLNEFEHLLEQAQEANRRADLLPDAPPETAAPPDASTDEQPDTDDA